MIRRFCAYGFLKNQQYYEPFLVLVLLEKGLSFLEIGLLIGFREVCIALLEIPSGATADLYGRRRTMSCSLVSYMISFILFAVVDQLWLLLAAMLFMGLGDAFRTGTHKAMIFEWLRREGRLEERTKIYGYTRSWSKLGSALSALIAAGTVLATSSYTAVFWICLVPYTAGLINILGYPAYLDGQRPSGASAMGPLRLSLDSVRLAFSSSPLRRILGESMLLEGVFKVVKDYLQPILQGLALALPLLATAPWTGKPLAPSQRGAILIGVVFCGTYLLMSFASRSAHRLSTRLGGDEQLVRSLWWANLLIFALIGAALLTGYPAGAVIGFICLGMIQNTFRPAQISRIDRCSSAEWGATILSTEALAKAAAASLLAPAVGWAVDLQLMGAPGSLASYWPAAALGAGASALVLAAGPSNIDARGGGHDDGARGPD